MGITISAQIAGIPCQLRVTHWEDTIPATWHDPAEGSTTDWEVLDRRGYPAPWLARKLDAADRQRLEVEINRYFRNLRYDD